MSDQDEGIRHSADRSCSYTSGLAPSTCDGATILDLSYDTLLRYYVTGVVITSLPAGRGAT